LVALILVSFWWGGVGGGVGWGGVGLCWENIFVGY